MIVTKIQQQLPHLLAIDLGLRFGWACYEKSGKLVSYGSHHCAQANKLKQLSYQAVKGLPEGSILAIEGGGEYLHH